MSDEKPIRDLIFPIAPPRPDGGQGIVRLRGPADAPEPAQIQTGILYPVEHGQPLHGGLLLSLAKDGHGLRVVEEHGTVGESQDTSPTDRALSKADFDAHEGPAKVTSEAYREGWDRIFNRTDRETDPQLN